ncbi:acyltransferase family protein [Planctomyces sp. SH-PL62]|uniref:acyltransferase family protein n=1 Tax=Planctomyces sp. SH-PL62 TaxID=1636152 RepID=UPI00078D3EAA|nr:acyltransferase [Planctomyces sp. SH-PL62]AMV35800.1 Acyltransferase family protein [Planctomyces sp. SH-PL62]
MSPPPRTAAARPPYSLNEKIDVCRGVFALLVVVAHAFELAVTLDPHWASGLPRPLVDVLSYATGTGIYYVMGFFILSGYCIQASVQRLAREGTFPLRTYLVARATRILPLYYAALAFAVAVEAGARASGWRPSVWMNGLNRPTLAFQGLLVQNFTETFGSFAPSWSITNEAAYYLLFGLIAAVTIPLGRRPAVAGMGLCVALGLALQVGYRLGARHPLVLWTGLLFGLGAVWHLGALVSVYTPRLADSRRLGLLARAWPAAVLLSMAMWTSRRVHQEFVYVAAGVAFALMLVRFINQDREARASGSPPPSGTRRLPEELGLISYPTYLFHGPLLLAFGTAIRAGGVTAPWWAIWPAAALFAIGCCLPLGRLLEAPIMAWRVDVMRRLRSRPVAPAAAAPAPAPALGIQR